jgi:hypothetical protein
MHHIHIHGCSPSSRKLSLNAIFLRILALQIESEEDKHEDEKDVTAHVCSKSDEVAGFVPGEEDLGAYNTQVSERVKGGGRKDEPIAFPVAQEMKFAATTTVFLDCPAMLREMRDMATVWAAQKERTR